VAHFIFFLHLHFATPVKMLFFCFLPFQHTFFPPFPTEIYRLFPHKATIAIVLFFPLSNRACNPDVPLSPAFL